MNESINIFTQRFNDTKIESEYLNFKWPRIWPFLKTFLFFTLLIKAFVMFEDIKLLGLKIPYISYHIFDIIVFIVFMFMLSDNNKKGAQKSALYILFRKKFYSAAVFCASFFST